MKKIQKFIRDKINYIRSESTALPETHNEKGLSKIIYRLKNIFNNLNNFRIKILKKVLLENKISNKILENIIYIVLIILILNILILFYFKSYLYIYILIYIIFSFSILLYILLLLKRKEEIILYLNVLFIYINISNILFFFFEYIEKIVKFIWIFLE